MSDSMDGSLPDDRSQPSPISRSSSIDVSDPAVSSDQSLKNHKSRKRTHGSHALQSLLEEANRYDIQYGSELPRGFLRDRSTKNDDVEVETPSKKLNTGTSVKGRPITPKKKETHLSNNGGARNTNVPSKRNVRLDHTRVHRQNDVEGIFVNWDETGKVQYNIIDIDYLRSTPAFHGHLTPSTVLTCKRREKTQEVVTVELKSVFFANYAEEYDIGFTRDLQIYNPMSEVGKIIEYMATIFLPQPYAARVKREIVPQLNKAFDHQSTQEFVRLVGKYNSIIEVIPRDAIIKHMADVKNIPLTFIHDFLHIVYTRSIFPEYKRLRQYEAFSNYVYGELLPPFLSEAFDRCRLKPGQIFMDLGSGVGNCVAQAALECGCSLSFGCEIMSNASDLTESQHKELVERCKLFGLKLAPIEFSLKQSFVGNKRVDELISRCDVLLINNFLFDSQINMEVEKLIQNAKVGCRIITLKNLRSSGYTINFYNLESILNRLRVERFELKKDSVSWTHTGGEYYISTVMEAMDESLFDPSLRQRSTRRPTRYTR